MRKEAKTARLIREENLGIHTIIEYADHYRVSLSHGAIIAHEVKIAKYYAGEKKEPVQIWEEANFTLILNRITGEPTALIQYIKESQKFPRQIGRMLPILTEESAPSEYQFILAAC